MSRVGLVCFDVFRHGEGGGSCCSQRCSSAFGELDQVEAVSAPELGGVDFGMFIFRGTS